MAAPDLLTYQDLVDHLLRYSAGGGQDAVTTPIRAAIQTAYRDLLYGRNWNYYYAQYEVPLVAPYSTGTIDYDHCVTPEHEALTRNGWSRYDDLKVGDEILAYDPNTDRTSWQRIEHLHVSYFNGELREVSRRGGVVLRCTPNHKFPAIKRTTRKRTMTPCGFVKSKDLTAEHFVPLAAECQWPKESALTPRQAAILGWAITDGHGLLDKDRDWGARISQSPGVNPGKCADIAELTQTKMSKPNATNGCASWAIPASLAKPIRRVIKYTHELPSLVTKLSREAAEAMYEAMLAGDGGCVRPGYWVFSQWQKKRKPIAEAFQILCALLGKAANFREAEYDDGPRYQVSVRTSKHFKPSRNSAMLPYSGTVWCPQVSTGAWVCRCNGYVTITGNSGGTYERQLTLSGGTWPTWAAYGKVIIAGIIYDVESRKSNTVLTLTENSNPGADVASSTSYSIYRTTYTMPSDYRGSFSPVLESSNSQLKYISPDQWNQLEIRERTASTPTFWTLLGDPNTYASMAIVVHPAVSTAERMRFIYQRAPRQLRYDGYGSERTGTVTISAAATAVTGTTTTFLTEHIGSVIRFGTTSDVPTGISGLNPYKEQQTIGTYTSATSIALSAAVTNAYSAVKYTISDPIDVYPGTINALIRGIEYQFAIMTRQKDVDSAYSLYKEAKIQAYESDNHIAEPRTAASLLRNNPGWTNPLGEDNT